MTRPRLSYQFILISVVAVFCYYIGSFLLVIVRSKGGKLDAGVSTEVSWRLFFQNLPQFSQNIYQHFFGYFEQYSRLYDASNLFLIPLDILTKLSVIGYFLLFWMPYDRLKCYRLGFFPKSYPYLSEESKKEIDTNREKDETPESAQPLKSSESLPHQESMEYEHQKLAQQMSFHPEYANNPYYRAQLLRMKTQIITPTQPVFAPKHPVRHDSDEEIDDQNDEQDGFMPFEDIHKPLEQMYEKHEDLIYDIIRRRILPGSNILLVGYFSTLFIVDYGAFWTIPVYILGVMSMFWCMQTFLMVIDYMKFGSSFE